MSGAVEEVSVNTLFTWFHSGGVVSFIEPKSVSRSVWLVGRELITLARLRVDSVAGSSLSEGVVVEVLVVLVEDTSEVEEVEDWLEWEERRLLRKEVRKEEERRVVVG